MKDVRRGSIWYHEFKGFGHVQKGYRPCVVVSNDKGNQASDIALVVPVTSKKKAHILTHSDLLLEYPSITLCEQLTTVNQRELKPTGRMIREEELRHLNLSLAHSLGFSERTLKIMELEEERARLLEEVKQLKKEVSILRLEKMITKQK